ncbi:beta-ketoacyl-ACP synthase II [Marinilabilia salmonicolor]|jgi:3-oxoacyl-[acyl-carrier-protein] synthase II|uniref:3-oxoacyl-[acyl-carrier-protein] synthase 2 n=1 Tax=Marinilabilia salmonicolor TaxID=989 RepID=A0A2T0XLL8_9BACT|nr:beta-ketoacyl-ACP synthase II [Marinilabilia salmonicolor]PRY99838.1 3-oxoacyl-[acyl-carrier-protein] synthase II [Marinilabilia salmonicolor]RCW37365.1 3-oxoacyl-[acyl-carrier-protein] synthase II [Marinilabilia salmonicolor]
MELKRVVVTGMGAITPIGKTIDEYWNNLVQGVSGAAPITRFDATQFKTQFACEVKDYKATDYFDRKEARKMDMFAQFAVIAAEQAYQDAGIDLQTIDQDMAGVIWGAGIGGIITFLDETRGFVKNNEVPRFNPFFIPKMISDIAAGHISIKYGFRGPNYGTVSACASASHAIGSAFDLIRLGKAEMFITGGSEAAINEAGVGGFNAMQAISTRNDDPATASRPFDKGRDGFVMGEGAGALVIEEYEHAVKRGAKIYCELVGSGMTADAHHITAPHPEGKGAQRVMENALKDGNINLEEVDYINVHGTSTPLGDIAEPLAIQRLFGDHAYKLNISSTKSMTGHLLGATGAIEAIASILAMKNSIVPPTINQFELDPEIDPKLNLTPNKAQERKIKVAMSNTFGFGGHNACVVFKALD